MRTFILPAALAFTLALPASAQWQIQHSPTTADMRGIDNVGNGLAWASGSDGTILRTTDSGLHWQRCATPPNAEHLDFRGIQAFDATTAIAMSSGPGVLSRLYKTTDRCQTWTLLFTNPDKDGFFDALAIVPQQRHKARRELLLLGDPVNRHFALWSVKIDLNPDHIVKRIGNPPRAKPHEAVFAASNSVLFVYGSGYRFLLGTGGQDGARFLHPQPTGMELVWFRVPVGNHTESSGIFSIGLALKPKHGKHQVILHSGHGVGNSYVVTVGGDYLKPDEHTAVAAYSAYSYRGWHWLLATTQPHGYRSAVAYDAPTRTWITVGPNGTDISTDDGRNWRAQKPNPNDPAQPPDADQHWNALSLPYVVGPHGRIGILSATALVPKK